MINLLNQIISDFMTFTNKNPVLAGVISLWGLGLTTYLCRELPLRIWNILLKQFTVEIELQCRDEAFFHLMLWFEKNGFGQKTRTLKMSTRDFEDKNTISAGFGSHYFYFNNRPYKMVRFKEEGANMREIKEGIQLTTIGRSQRPIRDLLKEIDPNKDATKSTSIYRWENSWCLSHEQVVRPLSSIILSDESENIIKNHLNSFKQDKAWFLKHGIPFRTGICFYGPPGTGKTSLVRAIAGMEGKDIFVLSLSIMTDKSLQAALETAESNSIILIEDIDTFSETNSRENNETKKSVLTLSGILNSIDGVCTSDGRLLIITTNHLTKLDSALIRPGRIDLCLELSYLTDETLQKGMKNFFPDDNFGYLKVREKLSPAEFQNIVREFKDHPDKILERVTLNYRDHELENCS